MLDYFDQVAESVEFLIALGSIIGFLGLIIGISIIILGGKKLRFQMIELIIISIMLLALCGLHTGTKYFRVH